MGPKLMFFIISIIVIGEAYFLVMLKKNAVELKYTLIWIIGGIVVLIFTIFQNVLIYLTGLVGIEIPANFVFFLGLIYILTILLGQTFSISQYAEKTRSLAQKIALLEKQMKDKN